MLFSTLAVAMPVFAHEVEEEEEEKPLVGNVTFGYLATSGNTETKSMNTGAEATYTLEKWVHYAKLAAIYAEDDGLTTAEAYEALWRSDWSLTDRDAIFGRLNWRKDRFGGFDTQFSQTVGYSRKILTGPVHELNGDLGAGARQSEDQLGVSTNEFIVTAGLSYKWILSETSDFSQTFAFEIGEDNTFSESVTSISATLVGQLRLVGSYTIRHNSDAPIGTEKRDTRTAIVLEYNF
jgi:putative salt-induced outer membrane protein